MLMSLSPTAARWWPALLCALLLGGCRKEEVRVYRVPKETPAPDPAAAAHAAHAHGAGAPPITWKAPAGWDQQDSGGMRLVRFLVRGQEGQTADVGVMPLTGVAINRSGLLNIYRTQAELGPLAESDLDKLGEKVAIGPLQGELFDMVSTNALIEGKFKVRILMASVKNENTLWLFKIGGADDLVREQRPAFLDFLKSVQFPADGGAAVAAHGAMAQATPAAAPTSARPQWEVPSGWQEQAPGPMVLAKFLIKGQEGQAEVTVSVFPGDTGGRVANVNRWRGQVGLEPLEAEAVEKQVEPLDVTGGKATLVDMTGTDRKTGQPARLIGGMVPQGGQTWFFKLLGHPQVAGREKAALLKFIQSARLSDA